MTQPQLKKKYNDQYTQVRRIVNEIDPIGLVEGGAPDDEYDQEVSKILVAWKNWVNDDLRIEGLYQIFSKSFGTVSQDKRLLINLNQKLKEVLPM